MSLAWSIFTVALVVFLLGCLFWLLTFSDDYVASNKKALARAERHHRLMEWLAREPVDLDKADHPHD
jgi:hypothetical protein